MLLFDFCKRVDAKYVNKKSLEGLIKAGAFSNIEKSRKQLFENIEHVIDVTSKEAKDRAIGQVSLFAALGNDGEDFLHAYVRRGYSFRRVQSGWRKLQITFEILRKQH